MIRLGAVLLSVLVAGTAVGQRAAGPPAVQDPEVARAMTTAARALLESVRGEPEFSERLRSYSMEDKLKLALASPEREKWAYWPTERSGLSFDLMHAKHRALTHELLWLLLSNRGYHKLLNIMQLENVLQAMRRKLPFGSGSPVCWTPYENTCPASRKRKPERAPRPMRPNRSRWTRGS